MFPTFLVPVIEYGFGAEAQPRALSTNDGRKRLDEMTTWDLCIGSTGRAQRPRALRAAALSLT